MKRLSIYTRTNQAKARQLAWDRDHGVCQSCGVDTVALEAAYKTALAMIAPDPRMLSWAEAARVLDQRRDVRRRLEALGFHPGKAWWEADHEQEVSRGGDGSATNIRSLCRPCHVRVTADYAGQRGRAPAKRIGRL